MFVDGKLNDLLLRYSLFYENNKKLKSNIPKEIVNIINNYKKKVKIFKLNETNFNNKILGEIKNVKLENSFNKDLTNLLVGSKFKSLCLGRDYSKSLNGALSEACNLKILRLGWWYNKTLKFSGNTKLKLLQLGWSYDQNLHLNKLKKLRVLKIFLHQQDLIKNLSNKIKVIIMPDSKTAPPHNFLKWKKINLNDCDKFENAVVRLDYPPSNKSRFTMQFVNKIIKDDETENIILLPYQPYDVYPINNLTISIVEKDYTVIKGDKWIIEFVDTYDNNVKYKSLTKKQLINEIKKGMEFVKDLTYEYTELNYRSKIKNKCKKVKELIKNKLKITRILKQYFMISKLLIKYQKKYKLDFNFEIEKNIVEVKNGKVVKIIK